MEDNPYRAILLFHGPLNYRKPITTSRILIMKKKDWVALIESGYQLEGSDQVWLENVLDKATPLFDRGDWSTIINYRFTPTTVNIDHVVTQGPSQLVKNIFNTSLSWSQDAVDIIYRGSPTVVSLSTLVFPRFPIHHTDFLHAAQGSMSDILGIWTHTGIGSGLKICRTFSSSVTPTQIERRLWPLAASHLAAGLRLRTFAHDFSFDDARVEAILDPNGKVHEAREGATELSVRESLRETVRRIEYLRSRAGRSDPDKAMNTWEALVQGRWSLVDKFDTDQRRYVVAIKNDPAHPDPRGLSEQERQVAEYTGLGRSSKEISYILGISPSAVTNCTARAQSKLGLSSRTELATFFSPGGLRAKLAEISIAGEQFLVGAYPLINEKLISSLTDAERTILIYLIAGSTNSDIAQRRKTSSRTVANQVQSIFNKLRVRSRGELAAQLQNAT